MWDVTAGMWWMVVVATGLEHLLSAFSRRGVCDKIRVHSRAGLRNVVLLAIAVAKRVASNRGRDDDVRDLDLNQISRSSLDVLVIVITTKRYRPQAARRDDEE